MPYGPCRVTDLPGMTRTSKQAHNYGRYLRAQAIHQEPKIGRWPLPVGQLTSFAPIYGVTPTMAELTPANGSGIAQDTQPQLMLQKIYVKDASFEAPNAPQVFQEMGADTREPEVQLNVGHKASKLSDNLHEVVLSLTLTCTREEHTIYLAEVHQAGVFGIVGFAAEDEASILASYCPNLLFPYARQMISTLVMEGGFPPFLLQPINFDALYAEQQRRQAAGETSPTLNS